MGISKGAKSLRRRLTPGPQLTQARIARELGVTQQAVSGWLRGHMRPEPERRAKLEELTGVPASEWDEEAEHDSGPGPLDDEDASLHAKAAG